MLKGNRTMNVDAAPPHVWDNTDWDRIAAELQRLHADWRTHQFTMDEFEDAMETVIAQEHHNAFPDMIDVMPNLYMAFARRSPDKATVKNKPKVLQTSTGAIRWTPEEWESVVLELHRIEPTFFDDRLARLSFPIIRAAQSPLPLNRRRDPNQIELYRRQLLKTWDSLPADVRDPRLQDRKIVDFPSGPIMEPPKQRSDDSSAIALAMHKGFQAPEKTKPVQEAKPITLGKVKYKRHSYDATDWLNIAREMYRQNPHAPYFTSAFQTVDLPALRAAQREVIPLERRRSIYGNHGLAAPLVAAFKALKEELETDTRKANETAKLPEPIIDHAQIVGPQEDAKPTGWRVGEWPEEPAAQFVYIPPEKEISAPVPVPAPTDFMSRIVAASKPLIGVIVAEFRQGIAEEVAKILLPQITGALTPMLESTLQGVKDAIAAQFNPWSTSGLAQSVLPIETPDYQHGAQDATMDMLDRVAKIPSISKHVQEVLIPVPKPIEKPKKLKIAIIGPRGGQEEQVRRAFPEFDFTFIENGHGIKEAGAHCALFIASNAYLNRANRDSLKAHVSPEKVRYIDGGMSTIKRTINVWVATQNKL